MPIISRQNTQAQIADRSSYFTDLARFAAAFESEDVLRKAIESLLAKIPTLSGVQRTHGTQEYGKDIIFYGPGALSETRLHACLVKNTPITGNVDSNAGARNVLFQAQQALDTPFVNSKGDTERVEQVYVMCPHDLPQTTLNSIAGQLNFSGQATFFCGHKLLKLFEDHWPEFLVFDSDLLPAYLNSLQAVLEKNTDLTNVVFRHSILGDISKQLSDIYVKPRFKQDLQEFALSETPIPNISEVEAPITFQRIKELAEEIGATGKVLDTLSIERERVNATRTKQMAGELHSLAKRLVKAWEDAYAPYKLRPSVEKSKVTGGRGRLRYGKGDEHLGPQKSEMQLILENGKTLHEQCDSIIKEATPIIEEFRTRVSRSNSFVAGNDSTSPIETLQKEEYRVYCSVQENSRLNPKVLSATTVPRTLEFPEDLLSKHSGPLLITAPAGFGKTTFCKWNTLTDAERFIKRESSVLPVFVPLHQFAQGPLSSFQDAFLKPPEIRKILEGKKTEQDASFRMRFYLDGLDEVPSVERQHELLELARTFMLSERNVDIILTAREHVFGLGWLSRVRLRELDQNGIGELVSKWLEHNESEVRAFFEQLSAVPSLDRLMEIPLLGTLIISVYRKQKKLPESKIRLYEIFVELLSGGWDIAKDVKRKTQFGSTIKLAVLGHLATLLHFNGKRHFEESLFRTAVKDTLPKTAEQWEILLNELIQDCLLSPVGRSYTFYHQSFQEYFAAQDLRDPSGKKQVKILRWFLKGDDWWKEVLGFYVGIAGNPAGLKEWVKNQVGDVASLSAIDVADRQKYLDAAIDEYYPATSVATL
jgi:hypothetical protein